MNPTIKPKLKANLKLVSTKKLVAGGLEPDDSMQPGEYVANCEAAKVITKGRALVAILEFRIIDGPHSGVAVRQWLTVSDINGVISLGSRYARHCALALGEDEIEPGDDLDPELIFPGKTFLVSVGYRLTEKMGGAADADNGLRKKDARDFLRVHRIVERRLP